MSLREARAKLAHFGQTDPDLWTLQFAQMFCRLGAWEVTIQADGSRWHFVSHDTQQDLNPGDLDLAFSSASPEKHLALGLCGLSVQPLVGAAWNHQVVFGEVENTLPGLTLAFEPGKAPRFPKKLWSKLLCFSPTRFLYHRSCLSRPSNFCPDTHWLELLWCDAEDSSMLVRPTGGSIHQMGIPQVRTTLRLASDLCWAGSADGQGSCLIQVRPGLTGPTQFYPVQAGCLLNSFVEADFPPGFRIIFGADGLPVDLGQRDLRQGPERQAALKKMIAPFEKALEVLTASIRSDDRVVKPATLGLFDLPAAMLAVPAAAALPGLKPEWTNSAWKAGLANPVWTPIIMGVPIAPKVTAVLWIIIPTITAAAAGKPSATSKGAAMAAGVPKPEAPSRKEPNSQAIRIIWTRRSGESWVNPARIDWTAPEYRRVLSNKRAPKMIRRRSAVTPRPCRLKATTRCQSIFQTPIATTTVTA